MFRWYRDATVCYAYLIDVKTTSELQHSRWFTRGWTLQELIAPAQVHFYSSDWEFLGSKSELQDQLWKITGVEQEVLSTGAFGYISVAKRMSWAANRRTTRVEDTAYCLMGIFEVNMPLLYGEGRKSFTRLQEEIMKVTDDHSIFAWGLPRKLRTAHDFSTDDSLPINSLLHSLFADSAADFTFSDDIQVLDDLQPDMPPIVSSNGVRVELPVWSGGGIQFAAISCVVRGNYKSYIAIPLIAWSSRCRARCGELVLLPAGEWSSSSAKIKRQTANLLIKAPMYTPSQSPVNTFKIEFPPDHERLYVLDEVHCLPHATYSPENRTMTLSATRQGPHATLFFTMKFQPVRDFKIAVVIGGNMTTDEYGLWTKCVLVLDEKEADEDFKRYINAGGDLIRCCATKSQLNEYLIGDNWTKIANAHTRRSRHTSNGCRDSVHFTQYRRVRWAPYTRPGTGWDTEIHEIHKSWDTRPHEVHVNVRIEVAPINIVERNAFVYIEVLGLDTDVMGVVTTRPAWWEDHQ